VEEGEGYLYPSQRYSRCCNITPTISKPRQKKADLGDIGKFPAKKPNKTPPPIREVASPGFLKGWLRPEIRPNFWPSDQKKLAWQNMAKHPYK
jgi:hypothetical protein